MTNNLFSNFNISHDIDKFLSSDDIKYKNKISSGYVIVTEREIVYIPEGMKDEFKIQTIPIQEVKDIQYAKSMREETKNMNAEELFWITISGIITIGGLALYQYNESIYAFLMIFTGVLIAYLVTVIQDKLIIYTEKIDIVCASRNNPLTLVNEFQKDDDDKSKALLDFIESVRETQNLEESTKE